MNEKVIEAVEALKVHVDYQPKIGIILGSGLDGLAAEIQNSVSIKFEDILNFPISSVDGHRGKVVCGDLCGVSLFALSGRVHYYEGYTMQQVVFPIRVMAAFGVTTLIVTNSVGAINKTYKPGNIVMISDHINLMGDNPLLGSNDFVDLTEAYSSGLRNLAQKTAENLGIKGYVKNQVDGSVFVEAEGKEKELSEFISHCKVGPGWSHVDRIDVDQYPTKGYDRFKIRH